ncbi:heat shock 70 kDa protein 17-like [Pyrus ussuriensis x Pyrus communis]|uniref:Heat shock 70 kDa protein 17-like n=1 Tax=Pyrus ussuriensis x Pyrus communis TaxID=2448454 RepID=A0A5N5HFJ6_9ROSA|nr:heat shock 70 kDa protein 17-like [Pyrus ussuriensis x Pyrus communis]
MEKVLNISVKYMKNAVIEVSEWVEVPKKNLSVENSTNVAPNISTETGAQNGRLETSEEFEKISTSEERQSFIGKLDEVQEWLYTDGEDATASEFQERLEMLKAIGDPIFFRCRS